MYYIIIMDFMHQSLHLMSSMLAMNNQILAEYYSDTQNTKYIYCPTSPVALSGPPGTEGSFGYPPYNE